MHILIVKNHEEQLAFWPALQPLPHGWESVEKCDDLDTARGRIAEIWHDIRPRGMRDRLLSRSDAS
ncbi:MAG: MbtH family NRPS accessory protein [Pseudomonadota bacterium]